MVCFLSALVCPSKGGAVVIWSKSAPSHVEFHRCTMENGTAGVGYENDPQGEGGALAAGGGTTVVLADCLLVDNYAGYTVRAILRTFKMHTEIRRRPHQSLAGCRVSVAFRACVCFSHS